MSCLESGKFYNRSGYERIAKLAPLTRTSYGCVKPLPSFKTDVHESFSTLNEAYGVTARDPDVNTQPDGDRRHAFNQQDSIKLMRSRHIYNEKMGFQ